MPLLSSLTALVFRNYLFWNFYLYAKQKQADLNKNKLFAEAFQTKQNKQKIYEINIQDSINKPKTEFFIFNSSFSWQLSTFAS